MTSALFCPLPNSPNPRHETLSCPELACCRVVVSEYWQRNRGCGSSCRRHPATRRRESIGQPSIRRRRTPRDGRVSGRGRRCDRGQGVVRQRSRKTGRNRFGSARRAPPTAEGRPEGKRSEVGCPRLTTKIPLPLTEERSLETTVLHTEQPLSRQQDRFEGSAFSGIGLTRPDPESVVCEYVRHPDQRGTCQKRNNVARRTGHSERAAPWAPNRGGASQLAKMLAEPAYFGKAEVFRRDDAVTGIASRKGMAAFWNIPGYMNGRGGHIDLIDGARAICGSGCYWTASEMWFWPLR